ncbi:mucin-5AC-like isoform X2 [Chrysoperla carnea]|uniref:mucin-5AC-like isoform X2 n=1 Tax=Chrysoperla carnea TaxID=189513 RepID=UPI001D08E78E|nr:mucin-5AC-like isoform X2 [Chrysoperla carnea]
MPQLNNSSSQNRKQQIRVRESTALLPAAFVESPPPPLLKNEIVDLEYGELDSPVKRGPGRPRIKTPKMVEFEELWAQKKAVKAEGSNDGNQPKSSKRKDTSMESESISPPMKRIKLKPGPKTSILNRPFDCVQISEEMKQEIIKNQPILRLQRINECIVSIKSKKAPSIATKGNRRGTTYNATAMPNTPESVVREPVFIAVEDDNTDSNTVSHPIVDTNDTNISSSVMCRLCGVAGPNRFSLIGSRSERLNLLCHLKHYLNIEIFDEENLPLHVCPLCSQTIISFYKFHGRVKTATNRLQAVVNESTLNPQRSWESVPWYGDNILATATATNDYLTKKHLRKLEENKKGKTKNTSTKFVTTNIEKLFGNKTKSNGINPELIVEPVEDEDTENADDDVHDRDWLSSGSPSSIKSTPKSKQVSKKFDTSKNQIETITISDADEPVNPQKIITPKLALQPGQIQTIPRLVLAKPPAMTPKPTTINNTIPILNSPSTGDNASGSKTYLIPIQNLVNAGITGLNQGSPLKFALSANGQPILLQPAGANTIKFVPNSNISDKNLAPKPLASIKGITNNTIITSPPVNVNQILTTSNTSIPIKTISPVATIVPNASPNILKPKPASTIVVSQPKVQVKSQQSLNSPKTTSILSTTSTSSATLITPLKSTVTKTSSTPQMPVTRTLVKISTPVSKTTSTTSLTKATPTSTKSVSTPTKPISIPVKPTLNTTKLTTNTAKPTLTPPAKGNPLLLSGKTYANKAITSTTPKTIGSPITTSSISKRNSDMPDCLPLDPHEERKLNEDFQPPSKDDKYTYVVRMDRNIGEQPYFILTANPIKLKSPELTQNNVGIICKDVYKAEVEKKRVQDSEGNFSNIGLHCWAQHIVWLWQLKLPGNVSMYVKQSADKILEFGQRKRIDFAKKCFEVSKQICTEAAIKSKNQTPEAKKSVVIASPTLPKLIPKDILPKLVPKDVNKTNSAPKLLPKKDSSSSAVTSQQLVLIPATDISKTGNSTVTYVISSNSNVKLQNISKSSNPQNILSNVKLISSTSAKPISSSKQQPKSSSNVSDILQNVTILNAGNYEPGNDQTMDDIIETVEVSTADTTDTDDANKKADETNKVQLVYTDEDKEGDGMFDMECVSEDEDHDTSNNDTADDILKQATMDALGAEGIIESDDITKVQMEGIIESDDTTNIQIETIETLDFDPSTSEMVNIL